MQARWFGLTIAGWSRSTAAALLGGTLLAGCTLADLRQNVFSGALGFVEGYTEELLGLIIPSPADLVPAEEEGG